MTTSLEPPTRDASTPAERASAEPAARAEFRVAERLTEAEIAQLTEILIAVVADGASVGFLAPLDRPTATAYWQRACQLMQDLGAVARVRGQTLLVLDTREGDPSNDLYRSVGYIEAGRVPGWARSSDGVYSATVFWYKPLSEA